MVPSAIDDWVSLIRAGDVRALSRAASAIESRSPDAEALLKRLFPYTGHAFRIGITGAPGAGKSTLVDHLASHYRRENKTVGIIAVDPSSPFTGGAILGDRIRMQRHAADEGIFIRSMATRGYLGGLAQATGDVALLLDAVGKDVILIETVGAGQGDVEIARLADCTLVVLVPGMGDDVQNLKAGLMEIGDVFVLNKADQAGADRFEQQLLAVLQLAPEREEWRPPVAKTVATEDQGVAELVRQMDLFRQHSASSAHRSGREREYWKEWLLRLLKRRLVEWTLRAGMDESEFDKLVSHVAARKTDPYTAVDEILARAGVSTAQQGAGVTDGSRSS